MKNFYFLPVIIFVVLVIFIISEKNSYYRVWEISDSNNIYVDTNKNYIFDEIVPFELTDIFYVKEDINIVRFPLFSDLSMEEKFYLQYFASEFLKKTLKNKFIKIKNNKIYINGKKLDDILLNSNLFFNDDINSQEKVLNYIKSVDIDDFVIYNSKSKKFHRINCIKIAKNKSYKLIKKDKIPQNAFPCGTCFLNNLKSVKPTKDKEKVYSSKDYFSLSNIKIYFLNLNQTFKPSKKCESYACTSLKNEIDNAAYSIDFAIYGINGQPEIFNALVNAQKRGVKLRWVFDYDRKYYNYYSDTLKLKEVITSFNSDKQYEEVNPAAIMHNKFFIFDNKKVWTGSANITDTDLTGFNANYSLLIENADVAKIYTQEFCQMYNGKFHNQKLYKSNNEVIINDDTVIKILFSPQDNIMHKYIIPLISNAKKYIYIPVFFFTDKELSKALQVAHNKGIEIKVITDATNASSKYTVHKELRKKGIKVKTENYAGKMHMKAIIIDGEISVLGSMNFTKSANNKNDENVLIIYNKDIAEYLRETFLYLWAKIPDIYEHKDPRAESYESIGSCFDGIDNDFDSKTDKEDSGCFIYK